MLLFLSAVVLARVSPRSAWMVVDRIIVGGAVLRRNTSRFQRAGSFLLSTGELLVVSGIVDTR